MLPPRRILAVADVWQGSDAYAYVRALRRMGHSVRVVPADAFVPGHWRRAPLRLLRRLLTPVLVREYTEALVAEARVLRPHVLFVFKGRYVTPEAIEAIRALGAVAVNVYPDVSFLAHGPYLPRALPVYDWRFTTKSFGLEDMRRHLGITAASFLPPAFDPETHAPVDLADDDRAAYGCDVSFIGTWSPKKQRVLEQVCHRLPRADVRVWGAQWHRAPALGPHVRGEGVFGLEYTKAMIASRINLAILSEVRRGAGSGDRITARTFSIPAAAAFMLHERTDELARYFAEGRECACFGSADELVERITYYLEHPAERARIQAAGRARSVADGYSVDDRARAVLEKVDELTATRDTSSTTGRGGTRTSAAVTSDRWR
jgi:glycosyltransferase involved in cell wall biosynthesis